MKLLKQIAIAALLIYICVQIVFVFPRTLNKEKAEEAQQQLDGEKKTEQILQGFHLSESKQGARDWELLADKAVNEKQAGDWQLQKATVHLYNKETKEFTVTGDIGRIDAKTKNISITGNVTVQSINGYVFKTSDVSYKAATRTIETESVIDVRGPSDEQGSGIKMTGSGLNVAVETSRMTILKDVKAIKPMKEGRDVEVLSNSAVLNGRTKEVIFKDSVKMKYQDMMIESPESTMKYSDNNLNEINFDGGVKALQGERKAMSQQLLLRLKEQKLVFKGNPVLMERDDELRGDQITLLEGGRKVKVEKAKATEAEKPKKP